MIPAILMTAYGICLDNLVNSTWDRAQPNSYTVDYEECATIVPYITNLIRAEQATAVERENARDLAALKAAMVAIQDPKASPIK